jgi:dihydroorotate dehydrogenase
VYRRLLYPLLQRADAERTHDVILHLLSMLEKTSLLRQLLQRLLAYDDPNLHVNLWDLHFANPLGVAAGLDKNAVAVRTWGALGFGHVEVGTVTPLPQPGNERPRVFRLPADRALINRMGFPGEGAVAVARRLSRLDSPRPIVGVNVGANRASVETGRAVEDYVAVIRCLYAYADYLTINVSSPNTAGLRDLQGKVSLHALVREVVATRNELTSGASRAKPLLLKIAPDLTPAELDDIVAVCLEHSVDGLVATNTTIARPPTLRSEARIETGGLSGAPLRDRSIEVIRTLHVQSGGKLPIIGVGGVFSAADVWNKLAAGARLVQLYTGFVYEGPLLAHWINRDLTRAMQRHGLHSITEITGYGVALGMGKSLQRNENVVGNQHRG